jgi:tRNA-splicing ligase RtcB
MIQVINAEQLPIKLWTVFIEDGALRQAKNLANGPVAYKHIAIMPDVHSGYGMPIGGVLAAENTIIPNAVGVDIGCGMCAVRTSAVEADKKDLKRIIEKIKETVPVGFNHHKASQSKIWMPDADIDKMTIVRQEYDSARKQVGTLGGGNHFIEIQKGSDDHIWIMIHSGSRNIGKKVADYYNRTARSLNEKWKKRINVKQDLAFLPFEIEEAHNYFNEMNYCIEFAFLNRMHMMENVKHCFSEFIDSEFENPINIAHNYANLEKHFNKDVILHRKGATSARAGEKGIIPGSQGTNSYIVSGLGNPESFMSCSHGAGRLMGRKQAMRQLNLQKEIEKLESKDIIHSIRKIRDLDEASSAYKDIHEVMENQKDLVEILIELRPLAVVKG